MPSMLRTLRVIGLILLALSMGPRVSSAQVLTMVELSFSNPGARSVGLGGAFVALADDATAAFANPAGLTQLARPEISVEGRSWRYSTPYTSGGRASGTPTGLGLDTVRGPVEGRSSVDLTGVSYLSCVYPGKRWSLALFRHQLMNFEMNQEIQGLFAPGNTYAGSYRGPIERAAFDLEIATWGAAVGVQLGESVSVGLGVSRFESDISLAGFEYLPDDDTIEGYFAAASFRNDRLVDEIDARGAGSDWGLAAGFLWRLSDAWRVGGAYRQGPELETRFVARAGPAHPSLPAGQELASLVTPWAFPDVASLGAAYRSRDGRWTGSFEWSRVEYSTILDSLDPRLSDPENSIPDADELHVGGEYVFLGATPIVALRAGLWLDPDHRTRSESQSSFIQAEHIPGADELHYAVGAGVAYRSFQIDLAVDLSELRDTASLSAIVSF